MKRIVVACLIVIAALVLFFLAQFPPLSYMANMTSYECSGAMTKAPNTSSPVTLFIKIRLEGWWVVRPHVWDAMALEIPGTTAPTRTDLFMIKPDGWFMNLYRWPEGQGQVIDWTKMKAQGQFSTISNFLTLNISDEETFRGTCTPKNT
jgi:hypothetical protein